MKKIILFLLLLISFSVFSQNPDRFRNGIRTQFVQPDTLSTANRDALNPKLGTIIFHKDTGFSRWEQWDGSDWVAFGGGSGSVNFASILGSPHDNANLGKSLDSTVHKWGNETIDSVKTFLRNLDLSPVKTVKSAKSQYRPLIKIGNQEFLNYLTDYWNGSSWTSTNGFGIGRQAIGNNKGSGVLGVGDYALENNIGINVTGVGNSALQNNTSQGATATGYLTGQYNTGGLNPTLYGGYSGRYNSGNSVTLLGHNNGTNNKGSGVTSTGTDAMNTNSGSFSSAYGGFSMRFNIGSYSNGFGYGSLLSALGDRNNGFGNYVLQYVKGNDNNVFGYNSFSEFIPNISGNKTFGTSDVNTGTDQITVTAHGFGATSSIINLKLTGSGATLGTGYSNGSINRWVVLDANTIKAVSNDITSTGTGTMTLTPQFAYSNVNILGNNLQPTQSDQTILGGATVVGPNTNKAAGIAGGNKVFLTREMGDQLYTGGGGGGTITLPLDATDIADGSVTNTELKNLDGSTSNIQTQLDGKLDPTDILDEDNMASNSDTHVPSQQSVKAYVDNSISGTIFDLESDTTPKLGGDLDAATFEIQNAGNSDFTGIDASSYLVVPRLSTGFGGANIGSIYYDTDDSSYYFGMGAGTYSKVVLDGGSSVVAERNANLGKYHFTSTASSETLTSALVEPATPNLGKKMWRTYTANDTITVPGNLPIGWSSVIEAGSATDSILIKADTGVDIYGQGNSFVQSGTGIDGLWLKKGRTVALIYKGANSVRAEGPWNVATITPPNLYNTANAASPIAEANATTGFSGASFTITSDATKNSNGSYSVKAVSATDGVLVFARPTGVIPGQSYNVNVDIAYTGAATIELYTHVDDEWNAKTEYVDLKDGNFKTYTLTGVTISSIVDSESGQIRMYLPSAGTFYIDNIVWTAN